MDDSTSKSRILSVTKSLLGQKSMDEISIREIAKSANVNVAAINYYFSSKDILFTAVLDFSIIEGVDKWLKINFNPKRPKKKDLTGYLEFLHRACIDEKGFARTRIIALLKANTPNEANLKIYNSLYWMAKLLNPAAEEKLLRMKITLAFSSLVSISCSTKDIETFTKRAIHNENDLKEYVKDMVTILSV